MKLLVPSWQQVFTYDRYGNRFQSGSSNTGVGFMDVVTNDISTSTNRFISTGSTPVSYNAAGNITQDQKFRFMNYTYDANGRQLSASSVDNAASQTSVYDAGGQRVQTTANSVTRTMVYDIFGQLVADYNGTTMQRENIYRGGELLAVYEASSSCYKSIADFVTAFYQGALSRNPTSPELVQWTMMLSQAQARGHGHLIAAAQSLGSTIFTSSEYTNLGTSDGQFVTDLYDAYLQRTPDSGGYNAWVAALATNSRTVVRNGFAFSTEFQSNVIQLCASTSTSASLKYVLTDEKGSARVLMENNGTSSAILARHDYLPFGEEIWAGVGLRTTSQKYSNTDKVRQRFAMTERDETTGLDHTWFRKYESMAGRWTSPDALGGSIANPQSFNRYAYVGNDPINFIDPLGLDKSGHKPGSGGKEGFPDGIDEWVDIFAGGDTGVVIESGPTIGGGPGGPSLGSELIPVGGPGQTPGGGTAAGALGAGIPKDPIVRYFCLIFAMLDVIAYAEGNPGYGTVVRGTVVRAPFNPNLVGQRNVTITNFSRHPEILVQVNKNGLMSTAAGRYQFLASTWKSFGLPDFSPGSQDIAATRLMFQNNMVVPLVQGNFVQAVRNGNTTWASLPGSPYGQPTRPMGDLQRLFNSLVKNC